MGNAVALCIGAYRHSGFDTAKWTMTHPSVAAKENANWLHFAFWSFDVSWILRLIPIPFLILLAGLVAGAAAIANVHFEMQKSAAREAGPPTTVSAADLGKYRAFPWFEEVSVRVQLDEDLTYLYWNDFADGTSIEYPVLFFVDPAQDQPAQEVLGAIAFTSLEAEDMQAYLAEAQVGEGPLGPILELSGLAQFFPIVTQEEIEWAAQDLGVSMSPNFLYLDPHFLGRDLRLEPRPELTYIAGAAAMVLLWLSMVASIFRRRWRRSDAATGGKERTAKKGLVAAAVGGAKMIVGEDEEEGLI